MKKILPALGVLFLSQLVFVGLIHMFLVVQGKNSPETLKALSSLPVIGGFFPRPGPIKKLPGPGDEQDRDIKRVLQEGDELFVLPRKISPDLVQEHIDSAEKSRRRFEQLSADLETEREALQLQKSQVLADQEEITKKIGALSKLEEELDARSREIEARARVVDAQAQKSYRRMGEVYAKMSPAVAAQVLGSMEASQAARIMETIEPRSQGKIFNEMPTPGQVDIQKYMLKPSFSVKSQKTDSGK